jgi:hypothetical protein
MAVITDPTGVRIMEVDAVSLAARTTLYNTDGTPVVQSSYNFMASPAGLVVSGLSDGNAIPLRVDRFGGQAQAAIAPLIWEECEGATLNSQRWTSTVTTFVNAQTAQGINLNSTTLTTANAVNVLLSNKKLFRAGRAPLHYRTRNRVTNFANTVNDFGLADAVSGTAQIANGAYFQITAASVLQGVVTTASTDATVTITWATGSFDPTKAYVWDILVDDDSVTFLIQDTSTGQVVARGEYSQPLTGGRMFSGTHLAVFHRCFNGASGIGGAPVHLINYVFAGFLDMAINSRSWSEILANNTQGSIISPTAFTQTQTFSNSAEPASMTLSNTVAGLTTLGGKFQFAAVAGAVTDYLIFAFTVPAPYSLVVRSISIDAWNVGAAVATTPTLLTWGCFANSTTASAAGNGVRRFLGAHGFAVGAAIGAGTTQIVREFGVPLITDSGRMFGIILRMPVGTATGSQVIAGAVDIDGYFE